MFRKLAFALVLVAGAGIAPAIAAPPLPGVAATDTQLEPARYRGYHRYYEDDYYDRDYYRDDYRHYRHNRYRHLYHRHSDRWRHWHRHHDHDHYRHSRRHRYYNYY